MQQRIYCWMVLSTLLWSCSAGVAKPVSEEFTAPLQVNPTSSRLLSNPSGRPRLVKDSLTGELALQARTAQTAITAAVGQHAAGCVMIRFGANIGWVATGTNQYPASENPIALLRSRQDARFRAFTDANTRLAGCLTKLSTNARLRVVESMEQYDPIRLALVNLAFTALEKQEQALKILARGYVAYSIEDDPTSRTIYVNLVTTPNTAMRLTRSAPNAIETISLQEGLRQTYTEIAAGLTPSVGNRLIVVNATGELGMVGYALNLIGTHPEPAAQEKLRDNAYKIAMNRAADALMSLAASDGAAWQSGLDEITKNEIQSSYSGYTDGEPSIRRFIQIRDFAANAVHNDHGLEALREGRLPPEATSKNFATESSIAVAVSYTPSIKPLPKPVSAPKTR